MESKSLFILLLILTISACTALQDNEPLASTPTTSPDSSNEFDLHTPFPTPTEISERTTLELADNEFRESGIGEQMPVFLEVIQTTVMSDNTGQGPSLGVGPNFYFYSPENQVLALNPTVALEPDTELLIGVVAILRTPNQEYEKREVVQYPSMQPALIQIADLDTGTNTVTILFDDEKLNLSVGESHTFKQAMGGSKTSTLITVISNHGQLAEIQPVSSDGSWR